MKCSKHGIDYIYRPPTDANLKASRFICPECTRETDNFFKSICSSETSDPFEETFLKSSKNYTKDPWLIGYIPISGPEDIKHKLLEDVQEAINSHTKSWGESLVVIYREDGARIAYLIGPTAEANGAHIINSVEIIKELRQKNIELTKLPSQSEIAELVDLRADKAELLKHLDEYFKAYDEAWADVVEQANKQGITSIPLTEPAAKLINQRQLLRFCYEEIKNEI